MSFSPDDVYLCVFDMEDVRSTDEKIIAAFRQYAAENGLSVEKDIHIRRTERGKPYFPDHQDIGVSVSHSGSFFLCALTRGDIGVDLEQHQSHLHKTEEEIVQQFSRIARRFFHVKEAEFVLQDPKCRFYVVWTAKESYVKLTGHGIDDTFSEHCVLPDAVESLCLNRVNGVACWQCENVWFWQSDFENEYTVCLCKHTPFNVSLRMMS